MQIRASPLLACRFLTPLPDYELRQQYLPMAQEVAERISWELGWRAGEAARLS